MSRFEIKLPELGDDAGEEATVSFWYFEEGEAVAGTKGQVFADRPSGQHHDPDLRCLQAQLGQGRGDGRARLKLQAQLAVFVAGDLFSQRPAQFDGDDHTPSLPSRPLLFNLWPADFKKFLAAP